MSVFLDANILFSASNSNLHRFLIWLHNSNEILVTSRYAFSEAERNILAKRSEWHQDYLTLISDVKIVAEAVLTIDVGLPDKDRPILGAAIQAECEYLLTGDKRDFGHLYGQTLSGVTVVSVLQLAEIMLAKHPDHPLDL